MCLTLYLIAYSLKLWSHLHTHRNFNLDFIAAYILFTSDFLTFLFVIVMACKEVMDRKSNCKGTDAVKDGFSDTSQESLLDLSCS